MDIIIVLNITLIQLLLTISKAIFIQMQSILGEINEMKVNINKRDSVPSMNQSL